MTVLPIPDKAFAQHTLLLGKTRSGKSSKMRLMVERLLDQKKPGGVIDPKGDWWGLKSSADGKKAGYPVVIFGGEHADVPINAQSGKAVAELVATGNRPFIIDLGGWMVGERTRFFIDFASMLFKLTRGPRWLAIDEVHNFAPQGKVLDPDAGKALHWANRLASEGAGKGITLLSASQRPQKVHKDYVTSHETLIALRVIHKLDRDAMKDWVDACGDPAVGKEMFATLASMTREEAWVYSPEIGLGPKRVTFPMFSTYDSFAAPTSHTAKKLKGWASVDLEEVKEKLAIAVEEAAANDPKALKARIAELERAVRMAPVSTPVGASKEDLKAAHLRGDGEGFERGRNVGKREGLVLGLRLSVEAVQRAASSADVHLPPELTKAPKIDRPPPAAKPVATAAPPKVAPKRTSNGGSYLSKAEAHILSALEQWLDMGINRPSREQVAFLARYHVRSKGFINALSSLRTSGYIQTDAGSIELQPAAPNSGMEVERGAAFKRMTGAQSKIVDTLLKYGRITRESLATTSGYHERSKGFLNALSALRSAGVLDHGQGQVWLSDWVSSVAQHA